MRLAAITLGLFLATITLADPFRPGIQDQIKLGQDAAAKIRKKEKVLPDSDPRVKELRRIGARLVAKIPAQELKEKPFKYSFDVVESKDINAFALPGGPVFFYSGLLDKMKTEDEIAAVVGHELTHVRNQHWASQYADSMKRQAGIMILLGLFKANNTWAGVAGLVDNLTDLKYSRSHESEADTVGYTLMQNAGYNPQGMVDTFEIFAKLSKTDKNMQFLSDHPDPGDRVKNTKLRIIKENRKLPAMTQRDPALIPVTPPAKKPPAHAQG